MALNKQELQELKDTLAELNRLNVQLRERPISINFSKADANTLSQFKDDLETAKLKIFDLNDGFGGIVESITAITRDWEDGFASPTKEATKSMSKLRTLASKLSGDYTEISELSRRQLETVIRNASLEEENLKRVERELDAATSLTNEEKALKAALTQGYQVQKDIVKQAKKHLHYQQEIDNATGLTGKSLESIRGVMWRLGLRGYNEDFKELSDNARKYAEHLKKSKNNLDESTIKAKVLTNTLKNFATKFKDEFALAVDVKALKIFKDLLFDLQTSRAQLSKSFGLGLKESNELNESLNKASRFSGELFFNTEGARKALQDFNTNIKGAVKLTGDELKMMALLSDKLGLSVDQSAELVKTAKLRGESSEEYAVNLRGELEMLQAQEGTAVNMQSTFSEIGNISAANRLTMEGQGKSLANAAFQSAKLGLSQAQLEKTSASLLNFESSIAAEMEAELLTGRQLNLEDARRAALMGDQADLAKAIQREIGSSADFGKMNLIQQQAIANAFGMSREELAETLETQELLGGRFDSITEAQEKYNELVKRNASEEEIRRVMGEGALRDQLAAVSTQEKFKAAVIKLKDALLPVVNIFSNILDKVGTFIQALSKIPSITEAIAGGFSGLMAGRGLVKILKLFSGRTLVKTFGKNVVKTLFKKIPIVGALIGIVGAVSRALKGDFAGAALELASGAASTFPGLGTAASAAIDAGLAVRDGVNADSPQVRQNGTSQTENQTMAIKELTAAINKGGDVYIDGAKVGKSLALSTSKIG